MAQRSRALKRRARGMRHEPTRAEDRMWSWLRDRRFDGWKFRRQVPIGRYIVDFYCAELRLVIELDGSQHREVLIDCDNDRTLALNVQGLHVLRIENELLIRDCRLVADIIRFWIEPQMITLERPPCTPSAPSPPLDAGEKGLD